jgi:hypothetical protein
MSDHSTERRCELTITGPLARSVIEAIRTRFDGVSTRTSGRTVLIVRCVDQAAIRALMIMLWDSGHEVLAMSTTHAGAPTTEIPSGRDG